MSSLSIGASLLVPAASALNSSTPAATSDANAASQPGSSFSSVLSKTVSEKDASSSAAKLHTKAAERDQKQQTKTPQKLSTAGALALPVHVQSPTHPDLRSWSLSLPKNPKEAAEKLSTEQKEPESIQEKPAPAPTSQISAKPVAFGVTLQKQSNEAKDVGTTPVVQPASKSASDGKSSSGKHSDTHSGSDDASSAGTKSSPDTQGAPAVSPAPAPATLPAATMTNAVPAPSTSAVANAYSTAPKGASPATQTQRTAEVSEPPAMPVSKPQSITFSTGTGANEVNVRVAERAGDVQVTVRTADADLATSLRQHIPELSDRLAQSGVSAEIWNPQGVGSSQSSSNSETASDDRSQQQAFTGNGEERQQQNRRSGSAFNLDGADGESN